MIKACRTMPNVKICIMNDIRKPAGDMLPMQMYL